MFQTKEFQWVHPGEPDERKLASLTLRYQTGSRLPGTCYGEVLSFLRPTVQTIIECPRLPETITVEWFLLCAPALR